MARPPQLVPRERLTTALRRVGPCGAAVLARELQVSKPTLLRMLHEQAQEVVVGGQARRSRYAALRTLRGGEAVGRSTPSIETVVPKRQASWR